MLGWLALLLGAAVVLLGIAPTLSGRATLPLHVLAAVLGGVVIVLAIVRIA